MPGCTVWVVEDDAAIREAVVDLLALEGFDALGFENGRVALDRLAGDAPRPCLILLDLMMPVMDGWDFLAARDADPRFRDVPVCVVSAVTDPTRRPVAPVLLRKPVDADTLLATVREYC